MKHLFFYIAVFVFAALLIATSSIYRSRNSTKIVAAPNNTVKFDTAAVARVSNLPLHEAFPWVAVDSNNISHVVYVYRTTSTSYQLMYTNNIGGTFKTPANIETLQTVAEDSRPIIVFANNYLHLFYTINETRLMYRRGGMDGTWGPGLTVSTATGVGRTYNGGIAVEPGGTVHFVYLDNRCGQFSVYHKWYDGGTLSAETMPINDCTFKNKPRAVFSGGRLHVIFRREQDIYYVALAGNTWTGAINISNSPLSTSHNPTVTATGNSVFAAWGEGENGHDVQMRYSSDLGQTWSSVLAVSSTGPAFSQMPNLTWVPSVNRGYIVWSDATTGTGGTTDILFHEFDTAPVDFNNPVKLNCMNAASDWPVIAAGPARAEVVWQDRNVGNQLQIYHLNGQVAAGQTTTGCGAPPPIDNTPTPTPTSAPLPTATPGPSPTPGGPTPTPIDAATPFPTATPLFGTPTPYVPTTVLNQPYRLKEFDDKDDSGQLLVIAIIVGLLFYTIAHALF